MFVGFSVAFAGFATSHAEDGLRNLGMRMMKCHVFPTLLQPCLLRPRHILIPYVTVAKVVVKPYPSLQHAGARRLRNHFRLKPISSHDPRPAFLCPRVLIIHGYDVIGNTYLTFFSQPPTDLYPPPILAALKRLTFLTLPSFSSIHSPNASSSSLSCRLPKNPPSCDRINSFRRR